MIGVGGLIDQGILTPSGRIPQGPEMQELPDTPRRVLNQRVDEFHLRMAQAKRERKREKRLAELHK